MRITNSLLLLIVTVLLSCGGVDRTEIVLNNDMPEDAKHLGGGVYVKLTSAFRKAKSFDGYVAGRNEATVSVQIDDVSLEKVAAQFAKDRLKAQGVELLAMQPVTYNDGLPGLFTMVKDKRKNTYRYLLSIERDGQVYNIKAFCFQPLQEKYEWVINTALKTAFIGEKVEKEEPFKIARIDLLGDKSLTYTRDGEYPTLAPDSATIVEIPVDGFDVEYDNSLGIGRMLGKKIEERTGVKVNQKTSIEPLDNAKMVSVWGEGHGKYVYGVALVDPADEGIMIICSTVQRKTVSELESYIRQKYLQYKLKSQ